MMATTHAMVGVVVGAIASILFPEAGLVPVVAGLVGGLAPDLDLYAGHRKTLHYPVYGSLVAAAAVALAAVVPTTPTVGLAALLAAAALHSVSDVLGGGLELRPWEGESSRAVYDHFRARWIAPKRWIRYDGSPEDLGLAGVAAFPAFALTGPDVDPLLWGLLAVSAVWVLVRRWIPVLTEVIVDVVPSPVRTRLPDRFLNG